MDNDEILKAALQKALSECQRLRDEKAHLRLRIHQSKESVSPKPKQLSVDANNRAPSSSTLTNDSRPEAKVSLFRSLFRGRDDVYASGGKEETGKLATLRPASANGISHLQYIVASARRCRTRLRNFCSWAEFLSRLVPFIGPFIVPVNLAMEKSNRPDQRTPCTDD